MKKTGRKIWIAFLVLLMLLPLHAAAEGEVRILVDNGTVWLNLKNFTEDEQYEYKPVIFSRAESDGEDVWLCYDANENWMKSLKNNMEENDRLNLGNVVLSSDKFAVEIFKRDQYGNSSVDVGLTKSVQLRSGKPDIIVKMSDTDESDTDESDTEKWPEETDAVEVKFQNTEDLRQALDYLYIEMEKENTILPLRLAKELYGITYEYEAEQNELRLSGLSGLFTEKPVIFSRDFGELNECVTSVINTMTKEETQSESVAESSENESEVQTENSSEQLSEAVSETETVTEKITEGASEIQTEEAARTETDEIKEETALEETWEQDESETEAQEIDVPEETRIREPVTEREPEESQAQVLDDGFVAKSYKDLIKKDSGSEAESGSEAQTEPSVQMPAETESEKSTATEEITESASEEWSEMISSESEESKTEKSESEETESERQTETESEIMSEAVGGTELTAATGESLKEESESSQESPETEKQSKEQENGSVKTAIILLCIGIVLLVACLVILLRMKTEKKQTGSDRSKKGNIQEPGINAVLNDDSEDTVDPKKTQTRETKAAENKVAVSHKQIRIQASAINNKGRVRTNNEDSFYLNGIFMPRERMDNGALLTRDFKENVQLYAVCDGMGGTDSGEDASFCAVSELEKRKDDYQFLAEEQEIKDMLRQISDRVYEEAAARGQKSGTTVVMMLVQAEQAIFANVGDSRIYRFREQKLTQISLDHSKVQRMISMGLMTPEQARKDPGRHVITQYLGMAPEVRISPYIVTDEMQKDDIYILCSDGLTDMVEDAQIEAILKGRKKLQDTAKALFEAAMKNGGRDNATIVLVHVLGGL